jgi:hypothetical protein
VEYVLTMMNAKLLTASALRFDSGFEFFRGFSDLRLKLTYFFWSVQTPAQVECVLTMVNAKLLTASALLVSQPASQHRTLAHQRPANLFLS